MRLEKMCISRDEENAFDIDFGEGLCLIHPINENHRDIFLKSMRSMFRSAEAGSDEAIQARIIVKDEEDNDIYLSRKENETKVSITDDEDISEGISDLICEKCGSFGTEALIFVPEKSDSKLKWYFDDEGKDRIVSINSEYILAHNGGIVDDAHRILDEKLKELGEGGKLKELEKKREDILVKLEKAEFENPKGIEINSRCEWLCERIAFLENRIKSIENLLAQSDKKVCLNKNLLKSQDVLKNMKKRKRDLTIINKAFIDSAQNLAELKGGEEEFSPRVLSELKTLSNAMQGLERQLSDREFSMKGINKEIEKIESELKAIEEEFSKLEMGIYTEEYHDNVKNIEDDLRLHESKLKESDAQIDRYKFIRSGVRLSKILIAFGTIAAVCMFLLFILRDLLSTNLANFSFSNLAFIMFILGLASVVGGITAHLRLSEGIGEYDSLQRERNVITGQVSWNKQKLKALLGEKSYESYVDNFNKVKNYTLVKQELDKTYKMLERDLSRVRNEINLIKVRIQRSKERIYQLLKPVQAPTIDRYIELYEQYKKVSKIHSENLKNFNTVLNGETIVEVDEKIIALETEIENMQKQAEEMKDIDTLGCFKDLREECDLKRDELKQLELELASNKELLKKIARESDKIDTWEISSDVAEVDLNIAELYVEQEALKLAISGFDEVLKDNMIVIGSELISLISEISCFLLGEICDKLQFEVIETEIVLKNNREICNIAEYICQSVSVSLAVNEITCGRGSSPVLCIDSDELINSFVSKFRIKEYTAEEIDLIDQMVKRLAKTRQVIWISQNKMAFTSQDTYENSKNVAGI